MKIQIDKYLENNIYKVTITTSDIDPIDEELFRDFGEPIINIGGEITDGSATPQVLAVLPDSKRRLRSQFPIVMQFRKDVHENPKAVANAWIRTIQERIMEELNNLRMNIDDFTGTEELII